MTSPCEKVIRRDIARTYPEHDFFKEKDGPGQETLFNVMKVRIQRDEISPVCFVCFVRARAPSHFLLGKGHCFKATGHFW